MGMQDVYVAILYQRGKLKHRSPVEPPIASESPNVNLWSKLFRQRAACATTRSGKTNRHIVSIDHGVVGNVNQHSFSAAASQAVDNVHYVEFFSVPLDQIAKETVVLLDPQLPGLFSERAS